MNKTLAKAIILILLIAGGIFETGCLDVKKAGNDLATGALEGIEKKINDLELKLGATLGERYKREIIAAMACGFQDSDYDPNMDGVQDPSEAIAWQRKFQAKVGKDAIVGLASGQSLDEVRAKAMTMEETLGMGSVLTLLGTVGLNLWRNRTRKKILGPKKPVVVE